MKIVVAGGSGALGRRLCADLADRGHYGVVLSRSPRPGPAREGEGLVTRTVTRTVPVTAEYRLADLGHGLGATVQVVRTWAYANIGGVQEAGAAFDATRA